MYLITLANNTFQYEFVVLYTLAQTLGWTVVVAGQNETWKGWRTKMDVYARACGAIASKEPDALVVCSDAYDVIPLRGPDEFSHSYNFSKKPIVVSAESHCGSNCRPLQKYRAERPYVNAGLVAGRARSVANMWASLYATTWTDDQMAMSEYMDNTESLVHLDGDAKILMTRVREPVSNDVVDGFGPSFLHLPGLLTHKDQRDMYALVVAAVARRTQLEHVIATRWASRHVPFQGDLIFYTLIAALVISCTVALAQTVRLYKVK
jgi:hypothetical protein